jgi:hypothetical protein
VLTLMVLTLSASAPSALIFPAASVNLQRYTHLPS